MSSSAIAWKQKAKLQPAIDSANPDRLMEWSGRLIGLMEEQYERYGEVVQLVAEQRKALVQNNLAELQSVNERAEGVVTELAFIESERTHFSVKLLALCEGRDSSELTLSQTAASNISAQVHCDQLLPHLPNRMAEGLNDVRLKLRERITKLQQDFSINEALALNGRKIIHATLGILTSVVGRKGADKHQVYGPQGKASYGRTQVRSLINRQV